MACKCIRQVLYCLQCAEIPTNIFIRTECNRCSNDRSGYVTCFLLPDTVVTESDGFSSWPVCYHGTTVQNVLSIIEHGELLMRGDVLHDGRQIPKRFGEADWENAIFTNPDRVAAEIVADCEKYDRDETEFKIILRLRQQPGTYDIRPKDGFGGYPLWSTNRRGTIYIEALDVNVISSAQNAVQVPPLSPLQKPPVMSTFPCPLQQEMFSLLKTLTIPVSVLDATHNRCYCTRCYPPTSPRSEDVGGETHSVPVGWVRFGLAVNPVVVKLHDIWQSWPTAYHGCLPNVVGDIIKSRTLLLPGDKLPNGSTVRENFEVAESTYYLSPDVGYAALPWYAKAKLHTAPDGSTECFQTVLVFKVRPGSYRKGIETGYYEIEYAQDTSIISSEEKEWWSDRRGCSHPFAILLRKIRAANLQQLCKFFEIQHEFVVESQVLI